VVQESWCAVLNVEFSLEVVHAVHEKIKGCEPWREETSPPPMIVLRNTETKRQMSSMPITHIHIQSLTDISIKAVNFKCVIFCLLCSWFKPTLWGTLRASAKVRLTLANKGKTTTVRPRFSLNFQNFRTAVWKDTQARNLLPKFIIATLKIAFKSSEKSFPK